MISRLEADQPLPHIRYSDDREIQRQAERLAPRPIIEIKRIATKYDFKRGNRLRSFLNIITSWGGYDDLLESLAAEEVLRVHNENSSKP